jgi:DNA-binding response OmpR family regulator
MDILVVEDNFLAGEMIRLAVEDVWFNVVGPVPTLQEGMRLADSTALDGAVLDIKLGGDQVFPLARHLRTKDVPFIFVTGYDRSVLPDDMNTAPLICKPVLVKDLARVAVDRFSGSKVANPAAADRQKRAAILRQRVEAGERRVATQRRRLQRLQFEGHDRHSVQFATDMLEQMQISLDLLKQTRDMFEKHGARAAASAAIKRPINDDTIDPSDPKSLAHWAEQLGTTPKHLAELLLEHRPSARVIARALGLEKYDGPSRKSTVLI